MWIGGLLALACAVVFANGLAGEWVYDDLHQIVDNVLIQDSRQIVTALTSDVWAFARTSGAASSNYWRPVFMLWLTALVHAFGVGNTIPWHLACLLVHIATTLAAYALLRRLGLKPALAGAVALIFAVHPSHVEAVTWISGSVDTLAAFFLVVMLLGIVTDGIRSAAGPMSEPAAPRRHWWYLALGCAALAMLEKETGYVAPALAVVALYATSEPGSGGPFHRLRSALRRSAPFWILGAALFLLRWWVLGYIAQRNFNDFGALSTILTGPRLLAFYVQQALAPLRVGPMYPLRPVTGMSEMDGPYWLSVGGFLAAAAVCLWMARRGRVQLVGAGLFILPLAPVLNISAFDAERLVHDRFLYLPVLGWWMMVLPTAAQLLAHRLNRRVAATDASTSAGPGADELAQRWIAAGAAVLAVAFAVLTVRYNPTWTNNLALWRAATLTDPGSAYAWAQYGYFLDQAGDTTAARAALDRALERRDTRAAAEALTTRARIALRDGRQADARADLEWLIANRPAHSVAFELLAQALVDEGQPDAALETLARGRAAHPRLDCSFSTNRAVVYFLGGARQQALTELERARQHAAVDLSPGCRKSAYYLGLLYAELGRPTESTAMFRTFLSETAAGYEPELAELRADADVRLR